LKFFKHIVQTKIASIYYFEIFTDDIQTINRKLKFKKEQKKIVLSIFIRTKKHYKTIKLNMAKNLVTTQLPIPFRLSLRQSLKGSFEQNQTFCIKFGFVL